MKRLLLLTALALAPLCLVRAGTTPLYENFGTVTNVPQIDAVAFANYGTFDVFSVLPYDTQNTLFYTNRGAMNAIPGFRFDYVNNAGIRSMASNFVNFGGSSILAGSGAFITGLPVTSFFFGGSLENPSLITSATNIVNHGLLSVGSAGILRLTGRDLDLSRGGLEIQPFGSGLAGFCFFGGSPLLTPTNFIPDAGVYDNYWGGFTQQVFNISGWFTLQDPNTGISSITAPQHRVIRPFINGSPPSCYFTNFTTLGLFGANSYVWFDQVTPTNWIYQTVFVVNNDPRVAYDVRFYPSTTITNPYQTVVVGLTADLTNVVSGQNEPNTVYLIDTLASETNQTFLTNLVSQAQTPCPTMLPSNFVLSRSQPCEFVLGAPANSTIFDTIFYEPGTTISITNGTDVTNITIMSASTIATNLYSAYSASVSNILIRVPPVPGASVTNLPGRVEVTADSLDLSRTRIRGEGSISIDTKHLVGSDAAAVDSENLLFSLASTNGNLRVQDLAKTTVERFYGDTFAWSAIWTNQLLVIVDVVTNGTSSGAVTNTIEVGYHALIFGGDMQTQKGVQVRKLHTSSTNVVVNDTMVVVDSLLVDADRFTLNGSITTSAAGGAESWNAGTAPHLQYFTNNGTMSIANRAWFGNDRPEPYRGFVNNGTLNAITVSIRADEVQNSGQVTTSAGITLNAAVGKLDGGTLDAGNDLLIGGADIKFRGHTARAGNAIFLDVSNSLTDSGGTSANIFVGRRGFNLVSKPQFGDLLGSSFSSTAPMFENSVHTWAAEDRGATAQGFTNNAAIGRLVLNVEFDGLLTFSGTGTSNGLYVDRIELTGNVKTAFDANDLGSVLSIDPNLVVSFADANVAVEQLDGQLGGRLRWVRDFAGPNSSVDVLLLNGQTIKVNRALRNSLTIDSDGDGVANGLDFYPFDAAVWASLSLSSSASSPVPLLSWNSAPLAVYTLEYTTNLGAPDWQPLKTVTNLVLTNGIMSILDSNVPAGDLQRFYRVRLGP